MPEKENQLISARCGRHKSDIIVNQVLFLNKNFVMCVSLCVSSMLRGGSVGPFSKLCVFKLHISLNKDRCVISVEIYVYSGVNWFKFQIEDNTVYILEFEQLSL